MPSPSFVRRVAAFAWSAALAGGLGPARAADGDPATDPSTWAARAATASAAAVVLVPAMAYFSAPLDESRLVAHGCRYATSDPATIRSLVALFASARATIDPVYQPIDVREAIYLTLDDGTRLNVFLADNHGGRTPVAGIVESSGGGSLRSVPVLFATSFASDLRDWAGAHGGPGDGPGCRRPIPEPPT